MSLRLLADENFDENIVRGLLMRRPNTDIIRVQEVDLAGTDDSEILAWAAHEDRILLTHDIRTMIGFAYERIRNGEPMPGVFAIRQSVPAAVAIGQLELIAGAGEEGEWEGRVVFLPLR